MLQVQSGYIRTVVQFRVLQLMPPTGVHNGILTYTMEYGKVVDTPGYRVELY